MTDYRAIARKAALQFGVPPALLIAQLNQESGFRPGLTSSAGARWIGQFIPSTARAYGVHDDISSIYGAAHYMADNLRRYGTPARALSAYNSGRPDAYLDPHFAGGQTYNYVRNILAASGHAGAAAPARRTTVAPVPTPFAAAPAAGIDQHAAQTRSLLNAGNQMFGLPALPALQALQVAPQAPLAPLTPPAGGAAPTYTTPAPISKWVRVAPTADRSGAHTSRDVYQFAAKIGRIYGSPLTIGTGTNHNQFVVGTHRQSDHWTGHAADIPSTGAALTRLGQDALVAAGMPPAQARKQTGGVYNIGRYQILFNTHVGGNHFNHLHVGVR